MQKIILINTDRRITIVVAYNVHMIPKRTLVLTALLVVATAGLWLFIFIQNEYARTNLIDIPEIDPVYQKSGRIAAIYPAVRRIALESGEVFTLDQDTPIYTVIQRELPGLVSRPIRRDLSFADLTTGALITVAYRSTDGKIVGDLIEIFADPLIRDVSQHGKLFERDAIAGTVTTVDPERQQITVSIGGTEYAFAITKDVVIHRAVLYTYEGSQSVIHEELNIGDIPLGSSVTLFPEKPWTVGAKAPALNEVYLGTRTFTEPTAARAPADQVSYSTVRGVIENVDANAGTLTYRIEPPFVATATSATISLADMAVYTANHAARAQIIHARQSATIAEMAVGDTVVVVSRAVVLDTVPPRGASEPFEIVIIK